MADFWFFHDFIFTNGSAKSSYTAMIDGFFKALNFTNDQHPQNSWNLRTSKKPTIRYMIEFRKTHQLCTKIIFTYMQFNYSKCNILKLQACNVL